MEIAMQGPKPTVHNEVADSFASLDYGVGFIGLTKNRFVLQRSLLTSIIRRNAHYIVCR